MLLQEKDDTDERRKIAEAKRNMLELESAFSSKLRKYVDNIRIGKNGIGTLISVLIYETRKCFSASTHSHLLDAFRTLKKMSLSAIDFQVNQMFN